MATSNKNMGMNPFVNRKVQRVDRITKDSTNQQIKKRNAKSEAPSFTNYRKLLDTVYLQNPILSLLFEMQSLTGLRFSDASTLIRSDFYDEDTNRFKPYFDFTPLKTYSLAYSKIANSEKGKTKTHDEIDSLARTEAMLTIFTNDRIREVIDEVESLNGHISSEFLFASEHRFSAGNPPSIQYANRLLKKLHKSHPNLGFDETGTHSFRKYFATSMVELNDANIVQVQALLGHKSVETTVKYVSKKKEDLQKLIKEMKTEAA
ncbi:MULTISPECIES: tyrosine-type recombinase/integrase [Vibrio]|uniref:tyrosine-type recombinase/integrase n=1 Tax=Vibrio TaxID=662 RepID=UPI00078DFB95|nr:MULTISPECIES: tyrosine-type recombinase/integrase [Vibrio]BAU71078.1 hypothetical protein [Vibrio sp. 04Ya108]BBM67660.1 hypothetical protein VA249_43060 [Vibrio alfacsensis]BCN27158.1 hypothetical protein VYA_43500 [Vibrio alfacsensis]